MVNKRQVVLKLEHLGDNNENGALTVKRVSDIIQFEGNQRSGEKLSLNVKTLNCVSKDDLSFLSSSFKSLRKNDHVSVINSAKNVLSKHPNNMWAHFMYGAACRRNPGSSHVVAKALASTLAINPNLISAWEALHNYYFKEGGFFSTVFHAEMCIIVKNLLRLEQDFKKWCIYVGEIWDFILTVKQTDNRMVSLVSPYVSSACEQKRTAASRFLMSYVVLVKTVPKEIEDDLVMAYVSLITFEENDALRNAIFIGGAKFLLRFERFQSLCRLIELVQTRGLLSWDFPEAGKLAGHLTFDLFAHLESKALRAISLLQPIAECLPVYPTWGNSCFIQSFSRGDHKTVVDELTKIGNNSPWAKFILVKSLKKLRRYHHLYDQILHDVKHGSYKDAPQHKAAMEAFLSIFSESKDPQLQIFALKLGLKLLSMFGLSAQTLFSLALANISLRDYNSARQLLLALLNLGCVDDVIYLKSLMEEDYNARSDILKSVDKSLNSKISTAIAQKLLGKPKKMLRPFLEASLMPIQCHLMYEWLGLYYYGQDRLSSAANNFFEAYSNNIFSWIAISYIGHIYINHVDREVGKMFLGRVQQTRAGHVDIGSLAGLRSGLYYLKYASDHYDYYRAVEQFRKCSSHIIGPRKMDLMAEALREYGMHGTSEQFFWKCHLKDRTLQVYQAVMFAAEHKLMKQSGYETIKIARQVAATSPSSLLALYSYASCLLDKASAASIANNHHLCVLLCQKAVLLLARCIATHANYAIVWKTFGDVFFTAANTREDIARLLVPSWLFRSNNQQSQTMVQIDRRTILYLALSCFYTGLKLTEIEEMKRAFWYEIGLVFRYIHLVYKEEGNRMLYWSAHCALNAWSPELWQSSNLCGVILTDFGEFQLAQKFFEDAFEVGYVEHPKEAEYNLGLTLMKLGDLTGAYDTFMFRRGSDPADRFIWYFYMLFYQTIDDKRSVFNHLRFIMHYIKHYPSIKQGHQYFEFLTSYYPAELNRAFHELKKSYAEFYFVKNIFLRRALSSKCFTSSCFFGDNDVPQNMNEITVENYVKSASVHEINNELTKSASNYVEALKLACRSPSKAYATDLALLKLLFMRPEVVQDLTSEALRLDMPLVKSFFSVYYLKRKDCSTAAQELITLSMKDEFDKPQESRSFVFRCLTAALWNNCISLPLPQKDLQDYLDFISSEFFRRVIPEKHQADLSEIIDFSSIKNSFLNNVLSLNSTFVTDVLSCVQVLRL